MYEVEVKSRLVNREAVLQKLLDMGCMFSEELHQIDSIFVPAGTPFPSPLDTRVLRVRQQNNTCLFTLKISQSSRQDSLERELEIKDGQTMIDIVKLLGFENFVTVDKKRIKTKYNDIEIVLDVVEGLGEFIEAEKVVDTEDPEARKQIQTELIDFLETIGVSKDDQVIDGKYDNMLYEKIQAQK